MINLNLVIKAVLNDILQFTKIKSYKSHNVLCINIYHDTIFNSIQDFIKWTTEFKKKLFKTKSQIYKFVFTKMNIN